MFDLPRIPLPTKATSADLDRLPASIRRQALFSARMSLLDPLVEIGNSIKGILDGQRSESESRRDIRDALAAAGYNPPAGTGGSLQDHTSKRRLDLILQQNVRKARGYAKRAADMDPDALDQWPAQELIRVMQRKSARNWISRWTAAGGQLVRGRMVALKTAPIWSNISRFGEPYPPFDYGSGMGLQDIDREEAEQLGLLGPEDILTPDPVEFPDVGEANLPGIAQMPTLMEAIRKAMGGTASFTGTTLSMQTAPLEGAVGTPSTLGLRALSDSAIQRAAKRISEEEARLLIQKNQAAILSPSGIVERFGVGVEQHWVAKGYDPRTITSRLRSLRRAFDAVREPTEVWERKGKRFYLQSTIGADGKPQNMLVISKDGSVETWMDARTEYADFHRSGTLETKQGG